MEYKMVRLLMNERLAVRAKSAIAFTFALLVFVWVSSALLLPPGAMHFNAGIWLGDLSLLSSTLFIFVINLLFGVGGIILMNQWYIGRGLAAGYYILLLRSSVFHGILRGTNSFSFPYASQGENILGFFRVGMWETLALCLICAATASLARYPASSHKGFISFYEVIRNPSSHLTKQALVLILAGIALLMFSALMEALNILFP